METGSNKLYIENDAQKTIIYGDMSTGQVLLGKQDATGYTFKGSRKLNVLGGILTDSIRVKISTDWSGYVFNDEYNLMPLADLENFIKENKHLPGIPTTNEVATNGIELGAINAKLLAKIEELTLHVIKQQQNIANQQLQITELRKLISEIKK